MTDKRNCPDFSNLSGLTAEDKHHWGPVAPVWHWLFQAIPQDAKVLEVGPGRYPFPRSDVFADLDDIPEAKAPIIKADINEDKLPFADKSFDFVYCRHTLEDLWNPFHACREMARVGHRGYIETPSPMAELCRGVDGVCEGGEFGGKHPPWRGYYHHNWIVWEHQGVLQFVPKTPLVETFEVDGIEDSLRHAPSYWNTYYCWDEEIKTQHWHMPRNVNLVGYPKLLSDALAQSCASVDGFFERLRVFYRQVEAATEAA